MKYTKPIFIFLAICLTWVLILPSVYYSDTNTTNSITVDLNVDPLYSGYQFQTDSSHINIGIQPLGVPIGAVAELLKRDQLLQSELKQLGFKMNFFAFFSGRDLNFFWDKGLDVGMSGDMPTLVAAAHNDIIITSLIKQEFSSLVAREYGFLSGLIGKKIAVPFGSNAHYSVLRALNIEGIKQTDVKLINLNVHQMTQAIMEKKIDAFAAWEPFPSLAGILHPELVIIHKGLSTSYLFFSKPFFNKHPEISKLIIAGQIRAMRWMNQSQDNLIKASEWQLQAYKKFANKESVLSVEQNAKLIYKGLLSISETPSIPEKSLKDNGFLHQAFLFLQDTQKINPTKSWKEVHKNFNTEILFDVLANKSRYRLDQFNYRLNSDE